jgi:hypothetical protein
VNYAPEHLRSVFSAPSAINKVSISVKAMKARVGIVVFSFHEPDAINI